MSFKDYHPGLNPAFSATCKKLEAKMAELGHPMYLYSGYRSWKEQDDLYASGRTRKGPIKTGAKGGYSWHNFRVAADYAFIITKMVRGKAIQSLTWDGPWDLFDRVAHELGLHTSSSWKGRLKERNHVQRPTTPVPPAALRNRKPK
jgi:peptidoglycan L-alanyl-D-glutamate endopeptidase CwlK